MRLGRFLLFLYAGILISPSLPAAETPLLMLPGPPPPLTPDLRTGAEQKTRATSLGLSFDVGENQYRTLTIDSTIGLDPKWAGLVALNYTQLGPGERLVELDPGVDAQVSPTVGLRFSLVARKMTTSYSETAEDFVGLGLNSALDWLLSDLWDGERETSLQLSVGITRHWQPTPQSRWGTGTPLYQSLLGVGANQDLTSWLGLGLSFTQYFYNLNQADTANKYALLQATRPRLADLLAGFSHQGYAATLSYRILEKGTLQLKAFYNPTFLSPSDTCSAGVSLAFIEKVHWTAGIEVSQVIGEGGTRDTAYGAQLGYTW